MQNGLAASQPALTAVYPELLRNEDWLKGKLDESGHTLGPGGEGGHDASRGEDERRMLIKVGCTLQQVSSEGPQQCFHSNNSVSTSW